MRRLCISIYFLVSSLFVNAQDIVVPSIIIPEQRFPAFKIQGKVIPGKNTTIGKLDDIILPDIIIPGIILPEINTAANYKQIQDIHFDDVNKIEFYKDEKSFIEKSLSISERKSQYESNRPTASNTLIDLFAKFDLDRSNSLDLDELQNFVNYINSDYSYINNNLALSPDQFISQGGGDCEDFSIMTSEFLTFWGHESYIGAFYNSRSGHAICLMKVDSIPTGKFAFSINASSTYNGNRVEEGLYLPIDYNYVGGFSLATEANMKLTHMFDAQELIGEKI